MQDLLQIQKKFQKERHFLLNESLPILKNQNLQNSDHVIKRISISTYIEKTSPKSKIQKEKLENQFRNKVLDTQNLRNEHQFLTRQLNHSSQKFNKINLRATSTFQKFGDPFPVQNNQKILSDLMLLQKKKKLKNIKSQIIFKKSKLFNEIQNHQRQKRQQETLHKKYHQNSRQILKQRFTHKKINSEISSITNIMDQNKVLRDSKNAIQINKKRNQSFTKKHQEKTDLMLSNKSDEQKIDQISNQFVFQKENKIKDYLKYFKNVDTQKRPLNSNNQSFQSKKFNKNDPSSNIPYQMNARDDEQFYTPLYGNSENINSMFYSKDKQHQRGIYRMLDQKDKNSNQQNDLDHQIKNAKMRIKFNHRKIVNLGKIQKSSGFGPSNGFDNNTMP